MFTGCLLISGHLFAQIVPFAKAVWISSRIKEDSVTGSCLVFQKTFRAYGQIRSARLCITAHGVYKASINNRQVSNAYFTPGFASYNKRLQYQSYNVKKLLRNGKNQFEITLTGGWYCGVFGGDMQSQNYGKDKSLLCRLEITYADGTTAAIVSDRTWKYGNGPVQYADFYQGEVQDTRIVPRCNHPVKILDSDKSKLVPTIIKPVTAQETFRPIKVWTAPNGNQLIDFGQNLAGFVRIKVIGNAGDTIKISHAEMLGPDGNFYTGNLRNAKATDVYVLNGKKQILEPHFTYHGFRYARINGISANRCTCAAIAVHNKLKPTGTFSCSDPMINELQHNIIWSMNSNFVDIPTDCPQRSERLGWTGDAQIFCSTAAFNRDVKNFYEKYLTALRDDQGINGGVPNIIPDVYNHRDTLKDGVAGWGDAATIIPWTLYETYGDKAILEKAYASMKAWVDYIHQTCLEQNPDGHEFWKSSGYGDWYAMGDKTSLPFIDQCFYYHSIRLLVNTATVLHKPGDIQHYNELSKQVKSTFQDYFKFNTKNTRTQTAYLLALQFDLLPDSSRQAMADSLSKRIKDNNNHLATGFLGTPYLLPVLTKYGYNQLAYTLLLQQTCPSWLYPITKGATTIWERWDAIKPDGTIQQCSFNHYAYGAVGQWFYEDMLGIKAASPGFKTILIAPHPDKRLHWAKGSYTCKYGKISSEWCVANGLVKYHVEIPTHTIAIITLAGMPPKTVKAGNYSFTLSERSIE